MGIGARLKHAYNAFTNRGSETSTSFGGGGMYTTRPDRIRLSVSNERSIIAAMYVRIAIDAASADLRHIRLDADGRYLDDIASGLQNCLTVEANLRSSGSRFPSGHVLDDA